MADKIILQKADLNTGHFTNDNTNAKGGISPALSGDSGNLLQLRDNGFYYGIEAPADTANLYVSSSTGNDANAGTRAAPLKTIKEAFDRNQVGTGFNIFLYEFDTHEWRSSWGDMAGKRSTMRPYGSVTDNCLSLNLAGSVHYIRSSQLQRPTVKLISDKAYSAGGTPTEYASVYTSTAAANGSITFYGLVLDSTDVPDIVNGQMRNAFLGANTSGVDATFLGCKFALSDNFYLLRQDAVNKLLIDSCEILPASSGKNFCFVGSGAQLTLAFANQGHAAGDVMAGTTLTYTKSNPTTEWGAYFYNITNINNANVTTTSNIGPY